MEKTRTRMATISATEVFTVKRPDTNTNVLVRAASLEQATAFAAKKFPLVLICPNCGTHGTMVERMSATSERHIIGYSEEDGVLVDEKAKPYVTTLDEAPSYACSYCGREYKEPSIRSIITDSQEEVRKNVLLPPKSYNEYLARREGWVLRWHGDIGGGIEQCDDFADDDDAYKFVQGLADKGSLMHKDVIDFIVRMSEVLEAE